MKTLVEDYQFDTNNRQIFFTGRICPENLEEILLITNVTTGDIIYNFADKMRGGSYTGNALNLMFDTSGMSEEDRLQIFVESSEQPDDVVKLLTLILKNISYPKDSGERPRITVDNTPQAIIYSRNNYTAMAGSTEPWYSNGSWSTVDAREQLAAISNGNLMSRMQRWNRS